MVSLRMTSTVPLLRKEERLCKGVACWILTEAGEVALVLGFLLDQFSNLNESNLDVKFANF